MMTTLPQMTDPHGIIVAITSICVVFAVLAAMYCVYTITGRFFAGGEAGNNEPAKVSRKILTDVESPLPGIVLEIKVKEGDIVKEGQAVAVIEAMKMENEICMEREGIVTSVHVTEGEFIPQGKTIITIV